MVDSLEDTTTTLQIDMMILQKKISQGNIENISEFSENLLNRSRSTGERDHLIEARIRMDRALLGITDSKLVGDELRWCVDRLNAICPGSALHGLALLNLANWHRNIGESIMSLIIHADISKDYGHPEDIIGLSRLEAARIYVTLNDLDPAMRHFWSARKSFMNNQMSSESLVASLEWLDLALEEVSDSAPEMDNRLENAAPRENGEMIWVPSNPKDIELIVDELFPVLSRDLSGEKRNDIGLIIDSSNILGLDKWKNILLKRIDEIQDPNVLEVLQS
ncbi:hypothetical protein OAU48_00990 [bacterium]|jgi:hypothetical protein|nr:hypothetical protein [Euryarchaeota archaeon]MDB4602540.1 hypothetical protein [Euryarchaeota archaeon]MDC3258603.1 hypothetical protein [bacterium]MDG1542515.1 hypothetical protein [Candidatus Thalassarchaeaceae archaeon]|tara:strand:+ start:2362 stop:3195 length:834 start_codon:yes stop_codon:yes gene_type:complete